MTENIQWRILDNRKDINGEFGLCQNGHECFVSSYLSFPVGKKAIVRCKECGVEILKYAPFKVTIEEIDTDDDIIQEIVLQYKKVEKVVKITQNHEYEAQVSIRIYLDVNQYDENLMNQLLDVEWEIRKKFCDAVFDFIYLSTFINSPVSSGTTIFQRN